MVLPADAAAVRVGRQVVLQAGQAAGVDSLLVEVAVLLTSEVVTNAVLHACSSPRLRVAPTPCGGLYVGVGDDSGQPPVLRADDAGALGGRGLHLVSSLSSRWGVRSGPPGKVVWFEVDPAGCDPTTR